MTKSNQTTRSIARHFRARRYEIAVLAAVSTAAACATVDPAANPEKVQSSSSAQLTSAQGIAAAQRGMNFLVPDAVAFTQANNCLSCHRQPDVLIAASISAQLLPGVTLDTSPTTGTGFIANLVTGNQQGDGRWVDSGSTTSMSAESLWALAGYARSGGAINVLPNVKKGLLWLVPQASRTTFPNDGLPFAGGQRTYLSNDFTGAPQMFDWYLPTAQVVFASRVLLDLDGTLGGSDVNTLSAQQVSYTDALEGTTMRALGTTTVQDLALTAIAMAESGRASTPDGQAIGAQLVARQTSGSGWADASSPDGTLRSVNTLTTGQALYALCRLGIRARINVSVGAGLDWLAAQQQPNGSWSLPSHDSAVSSSWALLAMACASNPRGTAEFNPLTANGSPRAPVTESIASSLNVTNTASDSRMVTITVTGGPPGAIVTVNPSSFQLAGDTSAPVSLSITLPAGLPANTSYPFLATVAFAAGGTTAASQITSTFTAAIGNTPDPLLTRTLVTMTNPPTRVDIGSTIPLAASVAGSDAQVVQAGSMAFALDGQVFSTVPSTGNAFTTSWIVPAVAIGRHTLHVAYLGDSGTVQFDPSSVDQILDIEPPAPPMPVVGGIVDGSSSSSGQYNLSGVGTPGDTIAILANGVIVRTATVDANGHWGVSFAMSPGAYAMTVVETGPGGPSAPYAANVSVQPTAPTIGGPLPGTTFTTMMTTVSGTATPGATINVMRGGVIIATTTAANDGTYSVAVNLAAGPNSLTVSQTVNGQTSALSGVIYNETPSAPSIQSPTTSSAQRGQAITVSGLAVAGSTVLIVDGGVVLGSAIADSNEAYSIPVTLSIGQNSLSATSSVGGIVSAPSTIVMVRVDSDAPFFPSKPADLVAYAPNAKGIAVTWPAISAFDAQDGQLPSQCDHASGAIFPIGSTTVSCSASDVLGNSAATSFVVKVVLQALPTLNTPPGNEIIVKTSIATGANVSFDVTADDAEGKPLAALCDPPSGTFFASGTTKVTCSATDTTAKTAASASFKVTVVPVPYYGVNAGTPPATPAVDGGGGCSMSHSSNAGDFGALAGIGLAIAAASRRRRKVSCAD